MGDEGHLRGLLEVSNVCCRQCTYCSIRAATLPMRGDLADDLRKRVACLADGGEITPETPPFNAGRNLLRTFNLDLAAAGIAKCDARPVYEKSRPQG